MTHFNRTSYLLSEKVTFAIYVLVYLFVCVLILWKKVNRLGVFTLPQRDQNTCSVFTQVSSSPLFILAVNFWTYCNFAPASQGLCEVVILFRWICLSASAVAFFSTLLCSLTKYSAFLRWCNRLTCDPHSIFQVELIYIPVHGRECLNNLQHMY